LTHYPQIIRQSGPLRKIWCFKFEQKHKQFKIYSHCITTRKNICLTLAKKYELKFAFQLLKGTNLVDTFTVNEKHLVQSNFKNLIIGKLKNVLDSIKFYSQICFKGVKYRPGYYLSILNEEILFYLIHEIVIVESKQLLFFCQNVQDVKYVDHIIAYECDPTNLGSFALLTTDQIIGPPIHLIKTAKGKQILRTKEYYRCI